MTILEEAAQITNGSRREIYGPPGEEFPRMAKMWSLVLNTEVTAQQVCLCMIAMKLMRSAVSPGHRDSLVDMAGYARILEDL